MAVSKNFKRLIAGYINGTIALWDLETRKVITEISKTYVKALLSPTRYTTNPQDDDYIHVDDSPVDSLVMINFDTFFSVQKVYIF